MPSTDKKNQAHHGFRFLVDKSTAEPDPVFVPVEHGLARMPEEAAETFWGDGTVS